MRERQRGGEWIQPHFVLHLPFYKLIWFLIGLFSILNDNVKTHLIFEFHFAAFPGKIIGLSITGKSPATLILAGRHS